MLQALEKKPELVKIYLIPILLFLLDFGLRAAIRVDLIDAGADMALLAVASFTSVLAEDTSQSQPKAIVILPLLLGFLLPWIFCLWSISKQPPDCIYLANICIPARLILSILSWFVGLTALMFAGRLVTGLLEMHHVRQG